MSKIDKLYTEIREHCKKFPVTVSLGTKSQHATISDQGIFIMDYPKRPVNEKIMIEINVAKRRLKDQGKPQ
jgi:hypothetical protein